VLKKSNIELYTPLPEPWTTKQRVGVERGGKPGGGMSENRKKEPAAGKGGGGSSLGGS